MTEPSWRRPAVVLGWVSAESSCWLAGLLETNGLTHCLGAVWSWLLQPDFTIVKQWGKGAADLFSANTQLAVVKEGVHR